MNQALKQSKCPRMSHNPGNGRVIGLLFEFGARYSLNHDDGIKTRIGVRHLFLLKLEDRRWPRIRHGTMSCRQFEPCNDIDNGKTRLVFAVSHLHKRKRGH